MKSLAIKTLVVTVAMALSGTPSLAATVELSTLPVSTGENRDTHSVTAATAPAPLYALTRLDGQTLAAKEMTDQELKAVEGGWYFGSGISGGGYTPTLLSGQTVKVTGVIQYNFVGQ